MAKLFDLGKVRGGVVVLGTFATLADLQVAVPTPDAGDAYSIGAAAPYDLHIWDERKGEWINYGPLSGIQGDPGLAATISIGGVSEGEQANVMNSGTENAAVFDFVLPRGKQGKAATVQIGSVTDGDNAQVSNSGTENAAVLNFVLPRGKDGTDGKDGADGKAYVLTEGDKVEIAGLVAHVGDTMPTDGSMLWIDTATEDETILAVEGVLF